MTKRKWLKDRDLCNINIGIVIALSIFALYTDIIGKEAYIEQLNSQIGWMPSYISIPCYIIVLLLCFACIVYNNKIKIRGTNE